MKVWQKNFAEKWDQTVQQQSSIIKGKANNTVVNNFNKFFSGITKNTENVNNTNEHLSNVHKILNPDKSVEKTKLKRKIFLIIHSKLDELSNDTTHNSLR